MISITRTMFRHASRAQRPPPRGAARRRLKARRKAKREPKSAMMSRALQALLTFYSLIGCVVASPSLEAVFQRYGTDKQANSHAYVHAYSMLLGPWRENVHSLLEVGIGTVNHSFAAHMGLRRKYTVGASLLSWRDYLPNARIVGLDFDAGAVAAVRAMAAADSTGRLEAHSVDTTDARAVAALNLTADGTQLFDVVIDDGLHTWSGQQATLLSMWSMVRPGGFYFIEDVVWGDIMKHASPGGSNPAARSSTTSSAALEILREGGGHAIALDSFWTTLSKHRYSTIIALQKPEAGWPARPRGGGKRNR